MTEDWWLTHLYGHIFIPFRACFITSSLALTLLLSFHRYRSINDPHNYYAEQQIQNKPRKAMKLAFCSFLGSWIVNLSVFFEPVIVLNTHEYWNVDEYNNSFYVSMHQKVLSSEIQKDFIFHDLYVTQKYKKMKSK